MGKPSYSEPDQLKIELLMLLGSGIIELFCYFDAISHQLFTREVEPDEWEIELLMLYLLLMHFSSSFSNILLILRIFCQKLVLSLYHLR